MELKKLFRIQDWWSHILPPIFMFFYWSLLDNPLLTANFLALISYLLILTVFIAIAGFFINDLFDIKEDNLSGKYNFASQLPVFIKYIFLPLILLLFIFISEFYFSGLSAKVKTEIYFIVFLNVILFLLYSVPPVRLKSRPFAALFTDALYSGSLFYVLAYIIPDTNSNYYKNHLTDINVWLIFVWGFIKGIRNYLTHLSDDYDNDIKSAQVTLSTKYGTEKIQAIANNLLPIEMILILTFSLHSKNTLTVFLIFFNIVFLIIWYISEERKNNKKNEIINDYYEIWVPVMVLFFLVYTNNTYYPLILIHTLLFPRYLNKLYYYTIFKLVGPLKKNGNSTG